jgi:branched-chain amino acid transport system substrate-binding protein
MLEGDAAVPFFGGSGQARVEFIEGAGPAAEGFVFGTGKSLLAENWESGSDAFETVSDFSARYNDAYGQDPDIFAGHAFDALSILVNAIKTAGPDADSATLRDAIESTSELIGYGGTFTYSQTDHNGLSTEDLALYRVSGGAWGPAK